MKRRIVTLPCTFENEFWTRGMRLIAGVDEAGRGPLAGPVVAAAVVFREGTELPGVNDSKRLSEDRREELFPLIMDRALDIGIGTVDHATIDSINIYQASILAMRRALEALREPPDYVLADGNSFCHETLQYRNIIKGDAKCFSIAAASIIAKVSRDRMMREFHVKYPVYGFDHNKGYGTAGHAAAIREHGLCPIHRHSFRPVREVIEKNEIASIRA